MQSLRAVCGLVSTVFNCLRLAELTEWHVSPERPLVSRPAERRDGDGDGNVDADLSRLDVVGEVSRRGAGRRVDGSAVSVRVGVDDLDGFVDRFRLNDVESGAKKLRSGCQYRMWGTA